MSVMGACEAEGRYWNGVGRGQCERGRRPSWGCLCQLKRFSYQLVTVFQNIVNSIDYSVFHLY